MPLDRLISRGMMNENIFRLEYIAKRSGCFLFDVSTHQVSTSIGLMTIRRKNNSGAQIQLINMRRIDVIHLVKDLLFEREY